MLSRLRENLIYKLFALVFAVSLHFYASNLSIQSRNVRVTVVPINLPSGLVWDDKNAPQVTVVVSGPPELINRVPDSSISANVDLAQAVPDKPLLLPIHAILASDVNGISIEVLQHTAAITLSAKSAKRLIIRPSFPATPPAGYTYKIPIVSPKRSRIEGSRESVDSVTQAVVRIATVSSGGTIDDDFPIVALNSGNNIVPGVIITPSMAHVHIDMIRVPASKTLLISPSIIGSLQYPYRITKVEVVPSSVTVNGRPEQLMKTSLIRTKSIDITGALQNVTRQVACVLPPGLVLSGGTNKVTVFVQIEQPHQVPPNPKPMEVTPSHA